MEMNQHTKQQNLELFIQEVTCSQGYSEDGALCRICFRIKIF